LRGGFGLFYDLVAGQMGNLVLNGYPGIIFINTFFTPLPINLTAPLQLPPFEQARDFDTVDPNIKLPLTYQFNFGVQQSLGKNQVFSVNYVGALGRRLLGLDRTNQAPLLPRNVGITRNGETSDYHALQVQFERRLSRGLQAYAAYTWSHALDTSSDDTEPLNGPINIVGEPNRGNSDFDLRRVFNAAITYNLPAPTNNRFARAGSSAQTSRKIAGLACRTCAHQADALRGDQKAVSTGHSD
jgi:hypothetical protein